MEKSERRTKVTKKETSATNPPDAKDLLDNLHIWASVEKTDPKFTRAFDTGSFKGTDINPQYRYKKMTSAFGPVGDGWGVEKVATRTQDLHMTNEIMFFVSLIVWYKNPANGEILRTPPGFGQEYIVRSTARGLKSDADAAKKAFTDAIGNAMKYIGVGADVFLRFHDDSRYVASLIEMDGSMDTGAPVSNAGAPSEGEVGEGGGLTEMPLLEAPEEPSGWVLVATAFITFLDQAEDMQGIIEYWVLNKDTLTLLQQSNEEEFERVIAAIRLWVKNSLLKKDPPTTEVALKGKWAKVGPRVASLKNHSPILYEAIRAGFKEISISIKEKANAE